MKTPLLIKTFSFLVLLMVTSSNGFKHSKPKIEFDKTIIQEPLELKLLRIRHKMQQGQIRMLQSSIEAKLY